MNAKHPKKSDGQRLNHVGDCLYRSDITRIYYAIFRRDGKQKKKSLKTIDRELAKRKLEELRRQVDRLITGDAANILFAEYDEHGCLSGGLAKRWLDVASTNWTASTKLRRETAIKALTTHLMGLTVKNIGFKQVEDWTIARTDCAPQTFNIELETLRLILDYGLKHGLILENPAHEIDKRKLVRKPKVIPTIDQFRNIVRVMRSDSGKRDAIDSANLLEGLAYSGCRQDEAKWILWSHVNFDAFKGKGALTIVGKPTTGTKNRKSRIVPMSPPLRRLLTDMRDSLPTKPNPSDKVFSVGSCRKGLETACRILNYPSFRPHHSWRDFFITNAGEKNVPPRTVAGWVGHSDGGVLVSKVYGTLRDEHSAEMAQRLTDDAKSEGSGRGSSDDATSVK